MRRLMIVFLVVMLSLALIGGACAKPSPAPAPSPAPKPAASPAPAPSPSPKPAASPAAVPMPWEKWPVTQISASWGWPDFFVTNGVATYYADAVAVAELVKKYSPMKTQVVQIGSGVKGMLSIVKGDAIFNNVDAAVVNAAFLGTRDFDGTKPGLMRGIAMSDSGIQIGLYVRNGSGIKTPADLKGKRVAYAPTIPVWAITTESVLKAYGMTWNDVKQVPYTAADGLPAMMRQNLVDMFIFTIAPGTPAAVDMTTTGDAYLVSIDPDKVDAAVAATGSLYPRGLLPAGTYKGQDKDILSLSMFTLMHLKSDVPESLAYSVTRILWEHIDEFRTMASSIGKTFATPKGGVAIMTAAYHAGAIRYYKEKGLWGAEQEKNQQKFETMLKENLDAWQKKQK